jgi:DDE superfamily endonuclease/Helix-turn-helix of DDE superfamily endonuclease
VDSCKLINIEKALKNNRVMKSLTGLSTEEFLLLVEVFTTTLTMESKSKKRKRKLGGGRIGALLTVSHKLFFILYYFKTYPTMDVAGWLFNVDRSKICLWVKKYTSILERCLGHACVLPERRINSVEEFQKAFGAEDIFIDGAERRVQRPTKPKLNKKRYSGKKKAHTRKNIIISNKQKFIHVVSPSKDGTFHDKAMLDKENIAQLLPSDAEVFVDKGFQGMSKLTSATINMPLKKPKNQLLTPEQKENNGIISSIRICVEHAIGGMKRYGVLSEIFRNKNGSDDKMTRVCAGLWNFHLTYG